MTTLYNKLGFEKFFYTKTTHENESEISLTEIYKAYLDFCVAEKQIPLKKFTFLELFSNKIFENYFGKIFQVENKEDIYFLNIRFKEDLEIEAYNFLIKELELKKEQTELTAEEKNKLPYFYQRREILRKKNPGD